MLNSGLVGHVALTGHSTLGGGDTDNGFQWEGKQADNEIGIAHRKVSPEFISTSGMKFTEGRDFGINYSTDQSNVIINESMEKMMGEGSAVGKIIRSGRDNPDGVFTNMTVIGVVNDYVYGNVYGKADP